MFSEKIDKILYNGSQLIGYEISEDFYCPDCAPTDDLTDEIIINIGIIDGLKCVDCMGFL